MYRVFVSCSDLFCADTTKHATDVCSRIPELCLELCRVTPCPWIWSGTSAWRSRFPRSSRWWWHRYDWLQN